MLEINEFVRDNVPDLINKTGKRAVFQRLSGENLSESLKYKLLEKANLFLEEDTNERLNDVFHVILSICADRKITAQEFQNIGMDKIKEKGLYLDGIFLEKILEKNDLQN